jgi:predicted RND superfamily exporter protein
LRRKQIIALGMLIALLSAVGVLRLTFSNDYKIYFDADNAQLLAYESLQRTYTKYNSVLFVIEPLSGNVFTDQVLNVISGVTDAGWQLPWSGRVDSLANYQYIHAEGDELIVEPLYQDADKLGNEDLSRIRNIVLAEPDLVQRLVSKQGHVTAVNVVFHLPNQNPIEEVATVEQAARQLVKQ